jgi:hypothetical protein
MQNYKFQTQCVWSQTQHKHKKIGKYINSKNLKVNRKQINSENNIKMRGCAANVKMVK